MYQSPDLFNVLRDPLTVSIDRSRVGAERSVRRPLKSSKQEMMVSWPKGAIEEVGVTPAGI